MNRESNSAAVEPDTDTALTAAAFDGIRPPTRDTDRRVAGESSFDGCVALTSWPRRDVEALLPPELVLARNRSAASDRHPVVFVWGAHTQTTLVLARAALPTGNGYGEFALIVPFVVHRGNAELHAWVARMYSGYFPAVWDGNARYGFAKDVAAMSWHGPLFVMTDGDGALLAHAAAESPDPWAPRDLPSGDTVAAALDWTTLPLIGRAAGGAHVTSRFVWRLEHARVRRARAWISIDAPLLPALAPGIRDAVCAVDVRAMSWQLTWPSACACSPRS